jgi:arsenate reductase
MRANGRFGYEEDARRRGVLRYRGNVSGERKRVLFLCTGNAARSQMSEALARLDYGDLLEPVSAGSRPAGFVHPLAILAIEELGASLDEAQSKGVDEFRATPFDLVVTVCDSAAADCPSWPRARHLVHWSIEDPSFVRGDEETRLAAFRATRDELRRRIDSLIEALRRSHPKRTDAELVAQGADLVRDVMQKHGFKADAVRDAKVEGRIAAQTRFRRRGRAIELATRTGIVIVTYAAGGRRLLHPDYMERLGVAGLMRFPGLSKDPLDAFRRLRTDLIRFGSRFLAGRGLKEFGRFAEASVKESGPAQSA